MSVTDAAKVLGVGRPALSNFLNGNAAASPDMAARIERAFGVPAQKILDLQAVFDAAQSKSKGAQAGAKTYVPTFLEIKANEIENWAATTIAARTRLAVLLRTLVNSTGIGLQGVEFPGNDDAERPGWDGYVVADDGTPWIPQGKSGWEFGTSHDPNQKANDDYAQRLKTTTKDERTQTTFVFVTPRTWLAKSKWREARLKEKQWKDVRVYDASNIEEWLEQSVPGQSWFADEIGKPSKGTHSLDKCWAEWANVADPPLVGRLFATAVRTAQKVVKSKLANPPEGPIQVAADSIEEALAFLAQLFAPGVEELENYRDSVVVFKQPGVLPKLAAGASAFIAVAGTREVEHELGQYARSIHSIVVYPRNVPNTEPDVILEPLNDEDFRASLAEMKFQRDDVERLQHESGRSNTVLRRRLSQFPAIKTPAWVSDSTIASRLVPILLVGTWNSNNPNDQIIVSLLAGGADYSTLERELQSLTSLNDSPVWSVGTYRGVISKIDLLFAISNSVSDLKIYFDVARLVLSEKDPSLELSEDEQWMAGMYGKTREISGALRKSISETLVLLAVHGNALFQSRLGIDVEIAVARLIQDLLTPLTTRTLEEHERDLPVYAEAAPGAFLAILEEDLRSNSPASMGLMRPSSTGVFGSCIRSGLLWALEGLAWSPATLPRAALILAKLAQIEITDNWTNKPISSLESIFRSWMPQTSASVDKRIAVLKRLADEVPNVAWQVCVDQFSQHNTVGHYSHKPTWRNDGVGFGETLNRSEVIAFARAMVDMAIGWKAHNKHTLADLIERIYVLDDSHHKAIWSLVQAWATNSASDEDKAWVRESIRKTVMSRRGVATAHKLQADDVATAAKAAYAALEPTDIIQRHEWLFRQSHVEPSADDSEETDYRAQGRRLTKQRTLALNEILEQRGFDGVFQLAAMGATGFQIGLLLAQILSHAEVVKFIQVCVPGSSIDASRKNLASGIFFGIQTPEIRSEILSNVRATLALDDFAIVLTLAPFQIPTWELVDELPEPARDMYWNSVDPMQTRLSDDDLNPAVERLLAVKRPRAAFSCIHYELDKIRPTLLFQLMKDISTAGNEPSGHYLLDPYYIAEAFKLLDESSKFSVEQLAGLEFSYIDALSRKYGADDARGIPNLERYVEMNPEFYAEAVAWVYRRKDGGEDPPSIRSDDPDLLKKRAERAYKLLDSLRRVPGRESTDEIDGERLIAWVNRVRQACADLGRREAGDDSLGGLLANAPRGNDDVWPCEPVRDVLEKISSREMARSVVTGLYNARGAHWRGEGGNQERDLASMYRKWGEVLEISHPFVAAEILNHIAGVYERDAKREDTDAQVQRRLR
jgi:plasmid maintenance system antidote protein VapI